MLPEQLSYLPALALGLKTGRGVTETEIHGTAAKEVNALYEALWARDSGDAEAR